MECFASQPGLVQTQLNMRKLDHSKLTSNLLDISTRIYGQRADRASLCLQRPASDPTVTGASEAYVCMLAGLSLLCNRIAAQGMRAVH